jgi:hypothetical protein
VTIPDQFKSAFDALLEASAESEGIALVQCRQRSTGKDIYVICIVSRDGPGDDANYDLTPMARMIARDSAEFDDIEPPDHDMIVELAEDMGFPPD